MASKKKEAEGIALLSMYNDEDMDPDEDDQDDDEEEEEDEYIQDKDADRNEPYDPRNEDRFTSDSAPETTPPLPQSQTPIPTNEDPTVKSPAPPTPQPHLLLSSPPLPPPPLPASDTSDAPTSRKQPRGIVDYAHDETAMSPEAEEGEIVSTGHFMPGSELQVTGGNFQEKTPPGTVHILTPSIQATPPQPSEPQAEKQEQSKSENSATMNNSRTEPEAAQMEVDVEVSVEIEKENVDPLEKFLPPPPKTKCPEELQKKINKFLDYKRAGKSFNADLRNRKDYRNPDFLLHAVRYQDIDQIGTCFSKDVFDPHGYDKSDYYDEIEADMKREMERKEQEKKRAQKVEFVQGGTQPGIVGPAPKMSTQIPVDCIQSQLLLMLCQERVGRTRKQSGIRWMATKGTLCTLVDKMLLFLLLVHMQLFYLLLMLVLDILPLRNRSEEKQKRKGRARGSWRDNHKPDFGTGSLENFRHLLICISSIVMHIGFVDMYMAIQKWMLYELRAVATNK